MEMLAACADEAGQPAGRVEHVVVGRHERAPVARDAVHVGEPLRVHAVVLGRQDLEAAALEAAPRGRQRAEDEVARGGHHGAPLGREGGEEGVGGGGRGGGHGAGVRGWAP